ncbi:MAG: DUF6941 family protein [Egibacteraceae bacterium]
MTERLKPNSTYALGLKLGDLHPCNIGSYTSSEISATHSAWSWRPDLPDLDYAVLCDFVRLDSGAAHIVAAGIDTIKTSEEPAGSNLGVALQIEFTRNECGRPHRVELHLQDADGERIAEVHGTVTPQWVHGMPVGWKTKAALGFNFGVVFPRYGEYAMEVMIDDRSVKSLRLRVVPQDSPKG